MAILALIWIASWAVPSYATSGSMIIGAGDKLYLTMPSEPKLTGELIVAENGKIYLPMIDGMYLGSADVGGKTIDQAKDALAQALARYYNDTTMTLEVVSANVRSGPTVSLFGAVETPGEQRHFDGMTLLDLLIRGRSILGSADTQNVSLIRNGATRKIDVTGLILGTDVSQNIPIQPGDYVIVPAKAAPEKIRVHVFGKVGKPGTIVLELPATITTAMAAVGGTIGRARSRKIVVIRMDKEKNQPMAIPVDFNAIMDKGQLSENIALKNDDVIFVPESSGVEVMKLVQDLLNLEFLRNAFTNNGF